jgi:hypothetical protein
MFDFSALRAFQNRQPRSGASVFRRAYLGIDLPVSNRRPTDESFDVVASVAPLRRDRVAAFRGFRRCRRKSLSSEGHAKIFAHHKGLGFDILDSESEACFVPDQEYQLLDQLIDAVEQQVHFDPHLTDPEQRVNQARTIGEVISHELTRRGFALYIPTDTLNDALINRHLSTESEQYVFDCDTGSLIFMTIAQNLGASTFLVDITLPSGKGHNYVQWQLDAQGTSMN